MIKRTALILITSFIFFISSAQEYTVNGYIKDAKKQEPIIGAAVFEANTVTNGTPTDTEGYFTLDFTKSNILLKVGYIGFKDTVLDLHLTGDTSITVFMQSATEIEEVKIDKDEIKWKPKNDSIAGKSKDVSAKVFNPYCMMNNIKIYVPHFIVLKPELTNLNDLFYSKSKGSNQTLTFVDGTRLYSTNQVLAIQPLINKNSIKSIKYFYENYPAKYGAYLSPVLDISMKDGDEDILSGSATISLINANANIQMPVIEGTSSIFVSGNINYFNNAYTDIFKSDNDLWTKPSSFDMFVKYTHKLSENDKVYASFFTTNNKNEYELTNERLDDIVYSSEMQISEKTVNTLLSAHWEHVFSPDFASDIFLGFSKYKLNQEIYEDTIGLVAGERSIIANTSTDIKSTNNDITLNLNFNYNEISDHNIEFGASATNHNFKNSKGNLAIYDFHNDFSFDTTWQEDAINAQEYIIFAQDKYTFSDEMNFFLGMHFSAFVSGNKTYFSVQPRITANYKLLDWVSLNASYSNYKQYIHFVSNRYAGLSSDIFVPSDENISPEFTHHFSIGSKLELPFEIDLTSNIYFEKSSNVVEYKDSFGFFNNNNEYELAGINIKNRLEQGDENLYGFRIILNKNFNKLSIKASHNISHSDRSFANLNSSNNFSYRYNNTHDFSLKIQYEISDNFKVGVNWQYKSGDNITPNKQSYLTYDFENGILSASQVNKSTYLFDNEVYTYSGEINSYKLPAYHRADIFANYSINNHTIRFTIYNVYNRKNTDFADFKNGTLSYTNNFYLTGFATIPFLPVLSYTYRFE